MAQSNEEIAINLVGNDDFLDKALEKMEHLKEGTKAYEELSKQIEEHCMKMASALNKELSLTEKLMARRKQASKERIAQIKAEKEAEAEAVKEGERQREQSDRAAAAEMEAGQLRAGVSEAREKFNSIRNRKATSGLFGGIKNNLSNKRADLEKEFAKNENQENSLIDDLKKAREDGDAGKASEIEGKLEALRGRQSALEKDMKKLKKQETGAAIAEKAWGGVKKTARAISNEFKSAFGFSLSIKDNFSDIMSSVNSMLDSKTGMATYDTSSSLFMNSSARNRQMQYGLSSSQTYGMSKAMSLLNMTDDDLMWMNSNQKAAYSEYSQKYAQWYEELSSSGVLDSIQELQLDVAMMKEELAVEFLEFFAENKDTIMAIIRGLFDIIKKIMSTIVNIADHFGLGSGSTESVSSSSNITYSGGNTASMNTNFYLSENEAYNTSSIEDSLNNVVRETLVQLSS